MKKEIIEDISIEHRGDTYIGKRKITGTRKLDQIVAYNGLALIDAHGYKPEDKDSVMLATAKQLLYEIVSGRTLSSQPAAKYGL